MLSIQNKMGVEVPTKTVHVLHFQEMALLKKFKVLHLLIRTLINFLAASRD